MISSLFIFFMILFVPYVFAQELLPTVADVVNEVSPAVVLIKGEKISQTYQPGRVIIKHDYRIGSGFIIDPAGYILTCHHIITDADNIEVELKSGEKYEAKILKIDKKTDISLLKISHRKPLPQVKIGDPTKVREGNPIIIIGNPLPQQVNMPPKAFKHSVACGVIGSTERVSNNNLHLFQLSLPVNFGNSGGPLFNEYGEVIGIVNSKMLTFNGYPLEGVGFALSIEEAKEIFNEFTVYKRKEKLTLSDDLSKDKVKLLTLLAIIAVLLTSILFFRISQNRWRQYKFIKKKLYKCVYAGDYQRFSTIIHKVLKNSFIKGKNYSLEPLM
ncbi:MAG: trypsin-like peptidase domain-containing protein, partial [bacterium]